MAELTVELALLLTLEQLLPVPGGVQLFLYANIALQLGQAGEDVG